MRRDFGYSGWDVPDYGSGSGRKNGGGGSISAEERAYRYRFFVPRPLDNPLQKGRPATCRIMMLSDNPFVVYEHNLYRLTTKHYNALCLVKNKLDDRGCPVCESEHKGFAKQIGFFTVINMGQVEFLGEGNFDLHHKERGGKTYSFQRMLLSANKGSDDSPGQLKKLMWEQERLGIPFRGTVWDVTRTGGKTESCGNEWKLIDTVKEHEIEEYLCNHGADRSKLELDPFDYTSVNPNSGRAVLEPISYEELTTIVSGGSNDYDKGQRDEQMERGGSRVEGAGYSQQKDSGGNNTQTSFDVGGGNNWRDSNGGDDIPF